MSATTYRRRWSDNDRYLGPFTYSWEPRYRRLGVMLCSGDGDDYPGAQLRLHAFGHTLIAALPQWVLRPSAEKVFPVSWDAATVARLGRNWYMDYTKREYGFTIVEGALHLHFGRKTHDSSTDQSKCYFLPWQAWRHVRHSLYDLDGAHFADIPERRRGLKHDEPGFNNYWKVSKALTEACPTLAFAFKDFDGEELTATTRIEEREWLKGEGAFKWLSLFRKPMTKRSLDLRFSGETGKRKGSWKGGTLGHGINMLPGELHEAAFRRYCAENNMTFVGLVAPKPERDGG